MDYFLPLASLRVNGSLVLLKCETADAAPEFVVDALVTGIVEPDATMPLHFDPTAIQKSSRKAIDLKIDLTDIGTIKGINAGVADKTPSIIANVLKFALNVITFGAIRGPALPGDAPAVAGQAPPWPKCTQEAQQALAALGDLQQQRARLAAAALKLADCPLAPAPVPCTAGDALKTKAQLESIATRASVLDEEIARVRAKKFSLEWKRDVKIEASQSAGPGEPVFAGPDSNALNARGWFTPISVGKDAIPLFLQVTRVPETKPVGQNDDQLHQTTGSKETERADFLFARLPRPGTFRLYTQVWDKVEKKNKEGKVLATGAVAVSQWGPLSKIDFDTLFGEDRTIGVTFTVSGALQQFAYKRNSRAEAISKALADVSGEAVSIKRQMEIGEDQQRLENLKREADFYSLSNTLKEQKNKYLSNLETASQTQ